MVSHIRKLPRVVLVAALAVLALAALLPVTAAAAAPSTCDLACVKTFGDQRIAERITALNTLNGKVQAQLNNKHITQDQANALSSDISTNQSGLNSLKAKLDAETDPSAARQDVRNIYLQFRIFAVVLPRDARQLYLDLLINAHAKMVGLEPKIAAAIAKAPPSQQAQLNSLFGDFKNQLQAAEAQIDAANGELPQLTPENFNNNKSAYETALTNLRNDERTAHTDLRQAAGDLKQIAAILKGDTSATPAASPTA